MATHKWTDASASGQYSTDQQQRIADLENEVANLQAKADAAAMQMKQLESILSSTSTSRLAASTGIPQIDSQIQKLVESEERYKAAYLANKSKLEASLKLFEVPLSPPCSLPSPLLQGSGV